MLDLFSEFAVDVEAEINGRWVNYKGVEFLVARAGNDKYLKELSTVVETHGDKLDDEEFSRKELAKLLAKTLLLGWKGEIKFKGNPLKYSEDNAAKLLSDPAMREFRKFIAGEAENLDAYRVKWEEEQEKN